MAQKNKQQCEVTKTLSPNTDLKHKGCLLEKHFFELEKSNRYTDFLLRIP